MFQVVVAILMLPIISQLILGSFSIAGKIRVPYAPLTRINSVCQVVLLFAGPKLIDIEAKIEHVHRVMPRTTFFALGILVFLLFLGVVASQQIWKKANKKHFKDGHS